MPASLPIQSLAEIETLVRGKSWICAELMYKPRPTGIRERRVFDFALASRLTELSRYADSAVVFVCNDIRTVNSLAHLTSQYPHLTLLAVIINPRPLSDYDRTTPVQCNWQQPDRWHPMDLTDRWARLRLALEMAARQNATGYLLLPAHDAVWGRGLLMQLLHLSQQHAKKGLPAAVSPYTYHQHSKVSDADIPPYIVDAVNIAFARDSFLRWRLGSGDYQAFWGKMSLLPFGLCGMLLDKAEMRVWEDDLEIDGVLRGAGYGRYCLWVSNPTRYRQALPVFDEAGLRTLFERTLHYSLNIPAQTSILMHPLDVVGRWRRKLDSRYARALALSETIIADCQSHIADRLRRYGQSWVDWGAYRYVVRPGDPFVQVWKCNGDML